MVPKIPKDHKDMDPEKVKLFTEFGAAERSTCCGWSCGPQPSPHTRVTSKESFDVTLVGEDWKTNQAHKVVHTTSFLEKMSSFVKILTFYILFAGWPQTFGTGTTFQSRGQQQRRDRPWNLCNCKCLVEVAIQEWRRHLQNDRQNLLSGFSLSW